MTPQDIYNRYKLGIPGVFETVGEADEAILAAIQEAFNVNATRIAELEKELQELREVLENLVQLKRWKDRNGKDEHYVAKIDAVWYNAFEIIDTKIFNNEK